MNRQTFRRDNTKHMLSLSLSLSFYSLKDSLARTFSISRPHALAHTHTQTHTHTHTHTWERERMIAHADKQHVRRCLFFLQQLVFSNASCCSVLQCLCCVAARCSVLQRVAVCCSVLQCVAVCCSVLQCVAVCCSVLQCVAVCLDRQPASSK